LASSSACFRQAAEVLEVAKPFTQVNGFMDKAKHLCALHKLPRGLWATGCEWLTAGKGRGAGMG
jgi:hypothetical protein